MAEPRIALCHEWITTYGGSEQVAQRLAYALGITDVFTFAARPELARELFPQQRIRAFHLGLKPIGQEHWQLLLPIMPYAWSRLDLSAYGAVITSSHSCTNAVRVRPGALHFSYCHSPMRYAWDWRSEIKRVPPLGRPLWPLAAAGLRRADRRWAARVDHFIANSHYIAGQIERCYGRESTVVHPPIETDYWTPGSERERESSQGDYFLCAGRLVAYKRIDRAIRACEQAGVRLVVAGDGPDLGSLQEQAGSNTTFVVSPSRDELRRLYRGALAFLNPGVEDFGMTMVEAQACGTPVIALGIGGALDAIDPGRTGVRYEVPEDLAGAIKAFDPEGFDRKKVREWASEHFNPSVFDRAVAKIVADAVAAR